MIRLPDDLVKSIVRSRGEALAASIRRAAPELSVTVGDDGVTIGSGAMEREYGRGGDSPHNPFLLTAMNGAGAKLR